MEINTCIIEPFCVIGVVGSSEDGPDYVQKLWAKINRLGKSIYHLAKRDDDGEIMGAWGLANDETGHFLPPMRKKTKTILYMAGLEVEDRARAPKGFQKWIAPGGEYYYAPAGNRIATMSAMLEKATKEGKQPRSCAFDFMPPNSQEMYLFLPVEPDPDADGGDTAPEKEQTPEV